jgi:A/G-specific adenine glycosylase
MAEADHRNIVRALLRWYEREHRKLPWRAAPGALPDPYHVLVSEAMLQQTQVDTVVGYFGRFLAEFPTIADLAAADEQRVLRAWQGLGYYRRARHLHAAARAIVTDHAGQIPSTIEQLRKLPGIGPYTAGAIASIAFGGAEPLVDGNVGRVLGRLCALDDAIDTTAGKKRLWTIAAALVTEAASVRHFTTGDFNQSLMELGARICVPARPACDRCPVKRWCAAHERGQVERYPVVSPRRKPTAVTHHVISLQRGDRHLLTQRGDGGLWAGMWQMPTLEECRIADFGSRKWGEALAQWALRETGIGCEIVGEIGSFEHITTHRRITFRIWAATAAAGRLKHGAGLWRSLDDVSDLPLSKAQQHAIAMVRGAVGSSPKPQASSPKA